MVHVLSLEEHTALRRQRQRLAKGLLSCAAKLSKFQRATLWQELADNHEQCLLNALRKEVGPNGDVIEAYRRWVENQPEEKEYVWRLMAAHMFLNGCGRNAGTQGATENNA